MQRFAKFGQSFERFAAVVNGGIDDFVIHATEFLGPLLINLARALFDGEFVFTEDEQDGSGGLGGGGRHLNLNSLLGLAGFSGIGAGFVDAIEHFTHVFDLLE